jgi:hypothetical protein
MASPCNRIERVNDIHLKRYRLSAEDASTLARGQFKCERRAEVSKLEWNTCHRQKTEERAGLCKCNTALLNQQARATFSDAHIWSLVHEFQTPFQFD